MTEAVPIKSFDSQIIYDSQEIVQLKGQEDSFLDQVLEKVLEEDSQTRIKREHKTKTIKKNELNDERSPFLRSPNQRRKRNNSKSGKWSGANRSNYYKAILKFSTEHPYYTLSWKYWKPEKFYPKMIEQINKNEFYYKKDVIQTKSFDQRQRKEYFQKDPHLDMIELALIKLKQIQSSDSESKQILKAYEQKTKQKSAHMKMLDEVLAKINEKKYEFEELYCKIMGQEKFVLQECPNSVFYS